jgi:hypothetical protein
MAKVGVAVFSVPGMRHLDRCLKSVEWADDVVVLKPGEGNSFQQVSLTPEAMTSMDWVLHLWGEEVVEEELKRELESLRGIQAEKARLCYKIPVRSYVLGRWIEGSLWGPSPSVRLIRKIREWPSAWWDLCPKEVGKETACLSGSILDYAAEELALGIQQVNQVSSLWAGALQTRGQSPTLARASLFSIRIFLQLLATRARLQNGFAGFTLSVLTAYATLLVGAKIWEGKRPPENPSSNATG